jgi:hypothetical protein
MLRLRGTFCLVFCNPVKVPAEFCRSFGLTVNVPSGTTSPLDALLQVQA